MKKYMLLYNGPATAAEDMSGEKAQEVMAAWGKWMAEVGEALVDIGQPMEGGVAVVDDGTEGVATQLSGYTIVQAEDLEAARGLAKNHPFLSEGQGRFSVEVHELLPVPEM
jgi:hypothetical protein